MKILFLSHDPFLPSRSGQRLRTLALRDALASRHRVEVLVPGGSGEVDDGNCPRRAGDRLRMAGALLTGRSLWRARFRDPKVVGSIERMLEGDFDLVVCAGLPSAFCLPSGVPMPPVWIDEQNVEWRILERAAGLRGGLRAPAIRREARLLRAVEEQAVRGASMATACSLEDAGIIGAGQVLPNASGALPLGFRKDPRSASMVFTGTLCWGPNIDAALWMAREIMPRIRASLPEARLRLVGREPAAALRALDGVDGVELVGEVPSVWDELSRASLAVAPIRMGSGTRIKILEASAAGVPTVSTSIGAEGLDFRAGVDLELADDPESFASACVGLLRDRDRAQAMGARAAEVCARLYGPEGFARRALELAEIAISKGTPAAR